MDVAIFVFLIPIVAIISGTLIKLARIRAGSAPEAGGGPLAERLHAMEEELSGMRQELGELQERLDFTERLLAQTKATKQLES